MNQSCEICQVDDSFSNLPVDDRGLNYGDGFFETIRIVNGLPILMKYHYKRIALAQKCLFIPFDLYELKQKTHNFLAKHQCHNGILKIIITRGSSSRGYKISSNKHRTIFQWYPQINPSNNTNAKNGIEMYPCKTKLSWQPQLAGIKHLNRLEQILARNEWHSNRYAEGLMFDFQGNIIEGVMSNIFIVHNNILKTPVLDGCGVKGVMRQWILDINGFGLPIKETNITEKDLIFAKEVFVCNSVFGIWPVIAFKHARWAIGAITRCIQKKLEVLINDKQKA